MAIQEARAAVVHTRLEWARMRLGRPRADRPLARRLLEEAKAGARDVRMPVIGARIEELSARLR